MKLCAKCNTERPFEAFYKNKKTTTGYTSYCKDCHWKTSHQSPNRRSVAAAYYHKNKQEYPEKYLWKQAKHRAKWDYNDLEFTITQEDIVIPDRCPYLGTTFDTTDKELSPSLDRIDSSKGYTKDNIRVISYKANRMKSNATEQELISFAKGVLAVHSGGSGTC
jgi:hypothetical protein